MYGLCAPSSLFSCVWFCSESLAFRSSYGLCLCVCCWTKPWRSWCRLTRSSSRPLLLRFWQGSSLNAPLGLKPPCTEPDRQGHRRLVMQVIKHVHLCILQMLSSTVFLVHILSVSLGVEPMTLLLQAQLWLYSLSYIKVWSLSIVLSYGWESLWRLTQVTNIILYTTLTVPLIFRTLTNFWPKQIIHDSKINFSWSKFINKRNYCMEKLLKRSVLLHAYDLSVCPHSGVLQVYDGKFQTFFKRPF